MLPEAFEVFDTLSSFLSASLCLSQLGFLRMEEACSQEVSLLEGAPRKCASSPFGLVWKGLP